MPPAPLAPYPSLAGMITCNVMGNGNDTYTTHTLHTASPCVRTCYWGEDSGSNFTTKFCNDRPANTSAMTDGGRHRGLTEHTLNYICNTSSMHSVAPSQRNTVNTATPIALIRLITSRTVPTFMLSRASSQPRITRPVPAGNSRGVPRSRLESNFLAPSKPSSHPV